jgi:molybdate transport system ATP-binding protein
MGLLVDIQKKVENFVLDVSFEMEAGTLALLGASGSGKSMTLKCIAGIETPDTGRIILDGRILFDSKQNMNLSPQERKIGYLFQNYALFPNMTVEENIGISLRMPKAQKAEVVREKIKAFYLEGLEQKKPSQLSGGQQQRVALARMLVSNPKLLMLDEPFSALDSHLRWKLEQELQDVIDAYQCPTLFVSHNRDEVYRMSDRIGVISNGKLEKCCEKKELFQNPELLSGAILTGCKNYSRVRKVDDNKILAIDWQVELETKDKVTDDICYVGIRAHHIQLLQEGQENTLTNTLLCHVVKVIDNTFSIIVMLQSTDLEKRELLPELGFEDYSEIRLEIEKQEWNYLEGDLVRISLPKERLLLLR